MPALPDFIRGPFLTNQIALVLACVIFAAIGADVALNSGTASIFLLKKLVYVIEYLAFWR